MCTTFLPGTRGGQERASDPLELVLEMTISHHEGSRKETPVLQKNNMYFNHEAISPASPNYLVILP